MKWRGWEEKSPKEPVREGLVVGAGEHCWWSWSGLNVLRVEDASWAEGESTSGSWSSVSKLQGTGG